MTAADYEEAPRFAVIVASRSRVSVRRVTPGAAGAAQRLGRIRAGRRGWAGGEGALGGERGWRRPL